MRNRILVGIGVLALVGSTASAYDGGPVTDGGSISGTVKFQGTPPERKKLEITKDKEVCGKDEKLTRDLVVSPSGGIQYAVVSVSGIQKGKPIEDGAVR